MENEKNEKKGAVQISEDVIAVIAATAAKEVDGVAKLVPVTNSILFGKKQSKTKGVELEIADGQVSFNVSIMALYNYKLRDVAQKVQNNIKDAVETMTGLKTSVINVVIADIDFAPAAAAAE
ncbi:MAG: Asp23/Gls24 family envelope stress response protein [Firmicutes bacterium]|nr:Asp23/Gls24 family envelope stress response protein [Bacillota bacterium]